MASSSSGLKATFPAPPRFVGWRGEPCAQDAREFTAFLAAVSAVVERVGGPIAYLEVGARYGDSLDAVSERLPRGSRITVIDLPNGPWGRSDSLPFLEQAVLQARSRGQDVQLRLRNSAEPASLLFARSRGPYHVTFIDADHSVAGCVGDVARYAAITTRLLALHDVSPDAPPSVGVPLVWDALAGAVRLAGGTATVIATPGSGMGIGLIHSLDSSSPGSALPAL